ncbi:MAG: hypothetical protein KF857_04820 [Fimbriimonadaceae bacterium]|nr:hypothetical protein [Fimbriimonadaceae bacterium]
MSIDDRLPDEPRTGQGPGGKDWLFALTVTVLLGTDLAYLKNLEGFQTAVRYYSQVGGVAQTHALGFAVDVAVILTMVVWFLRPYRRFWPETVLGALAIVGLLNCWAEVVVALSARHGAVYRLDDIPFRPMNNWGLFGAFVFTFYIVAKADLKRFFGRRVVWAKLALLVFLSGAQWVAYQALQAKLGL